MIANDATSSSVTLIDLVIFLSVQVGDNSNSMAGPNTVLTTLDLLFDPDTNFYAKKKLRVATQTEQHQVTSDSDDTSYR